MCQVSPKSHCDFLCFSMFSWAGCSSVNSSVLTFLLVGFGGNLVQGFRVYPWTAVQSFPQIVLCFSLFLMFSLAGFWYVNSSVLTFVLVGFGRNLVQGFRVYPWTTVPSLPQIVLWFSLFLMFSWAGCSDVNSSVLTFVLVGFGANLVQWFRVYPWRALPSLPQIVQCVLCFSMVS